MFIKFEDIIIPDERARSRWTPDQKAILESTIKAYGQLSDPLVRPVDNDKYELVDGESRVRAFMAEGMEGCEFKVADLSSKDASIVNVTMNIARGEQDPIGIAFALQKALDEGHTKETIAAAAGRSVEWVHFHIQLSILPEVYQEALQTGELRTGHVRQAFRLEKPADQAAALNLAITQRLKVNVLENYVDNIEAEYMANQILQEYISVAQPQQGIDTQRLIHTTRCLACNTTKPSGEICHPVICEDCYILLRHISPIIGCGQEGIEKFNEAINLYRMYLKDQAEAMQPQPVQPTIPQPIVSQPIQPTETPQSTGVMTKPPDMPQEEWDTLMQAINVRYGG